MHFRFALIVCSILASAAITAIPTHAESRYSTNRFEITFGDGWQEQPTLLGGDSAVSLMYSYSMMGFCYMTASAADHPLTAGDFDSLGKRYAGADSVLEVAKGSDSLGGKTFAYAEYMNADTSNGNTRIRLYSISDGSLQFQSLLVYNFPAGTPLISRLDSALSTLTFSPTPIRAPLPRPPLAPRAADHDILGRFRPLAPRSAMLRLPER